MPREERRYRMGEIALAMHVTPSAVYQRMRNRGIPTCRNGYDLDTVKQIVKRMPARRCNKVKVAELRKQLQNDGYL